MSNKLSHDLSWAGRELMRSFFLQMKPRPRMTVSEWADEYRYLPAESSPEPGKWKTDRAPYQRDIMNAINDPAVHTVVVMTCAQIGKSETLNNIFFYLADQDPCPVLMIQPTLDDARDYSMSRLAPAIRDSKRLRELFGQDAYKVKRSDNTILKKKFPGGRLVLIGANSPSGLASKPIRVLLPDEIDRYEITKEGDPIELARKRTTNFYNRLMVLTSTPGLKGKSTIEKWYNLSDKRNYFVTCPGCGKEMTLKWQVGGRYLVVCDKDKKGNLIPETALYSCEHCGELFNDSQVNDMVKKGRWKATAPFNGIAGFGDFPAMYSPWVKMADMIRDWNAAQEDEELLRVFINTALGQPYEEKNQKLETNDIFKRREPYGLLIPKDAAVLTAGVDVQEDRLEAFVVAWGRDERAWAMEHVVFMGDPGIPFKQLAQGELFDDGGAPGVWNQLDVFLKKRYDHESGVQLKIACCAIDTGYKTDSVYAFVRPREYRGIVAIKGASQRGKPIISRPSRKNKGGVSLFNAGVFAAKDVIMSRLNITDENRPGYIHFSDRFSLEFFEQLTAEKKITVKRHGQTVQEWILIRPRNEAFDMMIYNLLALRISYPDRSSLNASVDRIALSPKMKQEETKQEELSQSKQFLQERIKAIKGKRKSGWMAGI
ncbi:MAG: phage terminase large subunit family protein [Spirochaetes bacterium]|nr:phage terminase large subunit family protein [Spirochaetota bacterium]